MPKLDEVKEKVRQDTMRAKAADLSKQRATELAGGLKSAANRRRQGAGSRSEDTDLITRGAAFPTSARTPKWRAAFSLPVGGERPDLHVRGTVIIRVVQRRGHAGAAEVRQRGVPPSWSTSAAATSSTRKMGKAKERMKVEINAEVVTRVTSALRL